MKVSAMRAGRNDNFDSGHSKVGELAWKALPRSLDRIEPFYAS